MQEQIIISHISRHGTGWDVTVQVGEQSDHSTTHNVTVDDDYYQKLTNGQVDVETLVENVFEFLLAREDKEQILPNFDLEVVASYFDDFEVEIDKQLRQL